MAQKPEATDALDEPPPFLSSWRQVYWLLIVQLAVLVLLFYALTWWAQ